MEHLHSIQKLPIGPEQLLISNLIDFCVNLAGVIPRSRHMVHNMSWIRIFDQSSEGFLCETVLVVPHHIPFHIWIQLFSSEDTVASVLEHLSNMGHVGVMGLKDLIITVSGNS